ncbi:MAG: Gfo/Idh/MocA family oxidoreductase [Verrucomicrobiota bacterium]
MPDLKAINIAFIGSGDISVLHANAVHACQGAELKGLWSIDTELDEKRAKTLGCITYQSAAELVADPEVDAVFILTPLETHTQYAILALEHEKHILIEKPVAPTTDELEKIRKLGEEKGLIVFPGHNYIHDPSFQRTRRLLHEGKLGQLVTVSIQYHIFHPPEVARRYPGVIRHLLTHHTYLLLSLAGPDDPPVQVAAMKSSIHDDNSREEDLAMLTIKLKSGALAHFTASFAADDNSSDPWTFIIKVIGTDGATRYSYRDWVENQPGPAHAHTWSAYPESIVNEVSFFVNACILNKLPPPSSIDDAITCLRIIEAAEESIARSQIVSLGT